MRNFTLLLFALLAACAHAQPPAAAPVQGYTIAATYPHDRQAFTQGLIWRDGHLYESTGHVGRSTIRKVRLEDGKPLQNVAIPPTLFGEGITDWGNEIISITWQDGIGYRWDLATLRPRAEWRYSGEGWGLTQDGKSIIMSDGTSELRYLDPVTLAEQKRLTVTDGGAPVSQLNELEWVNGEIFANVWMSPRIARIDPATGRVKAWIDLSELVAANQQAGTDFVLNGIAYDNARDRLFVTGKHWPRLYEIDLAAP